MMGRIGEVLILRQLLRQPRPQAHHLRPRVLRPQVRQRVPQARVLVPQARVLVPQAHQVVQPQLAVRQVRQFNI